MKRQIGWATVALLAGISLWWMRGDNAADGPTSSLPVGEDTWAETDDPAASGRDASVPDESPGDGQAYLGPSRSREQESGDPVLDVGTPSPQLEWPTALSGLEVDRGDAAESADLRITVTGPLDPRVVARISRAHGNELRHCHDLALEADPDAGGMVRARYTVDEHGDVLDVAIERDDLDFQPAADCIETALYRWRFPARGEGNSEVVFPFRLSPV